MPDPQWASSLNWDVQRLPVPEDTPLMQAGLTSQSAAGTPDGNGFGTVEDLRQ